MYCNFNIHAAKKLIPLSHPTKTLVGSLHKGVCIKPGIGNGSLMRSSCRGFSSSMNYHRTEYDGGPGMRSSSKTRFPPWRAAVKKSKDVKRVVPLSSWEEAADRLDVRTSSKPKIRNWEEDSEAKVFTKASGGGASRVENYDLPPGRSVWTRDMRNMSEKNEDAEEERGGFDDWRVNSVRGGRGGYERIDGRRWSRQDEWGRKPVAFKEESSVPKMIGEGIYGVAPVLAALSAQRRESYKLYVQQGLDLSSKNKKKKDKVGFEKILRMAEKNGIAINELSKHDLNMISDNRPHQGLVLDASPLDMVRVQELDPAPIGSQKGGGALWVALDEVTDPQNLGAIIRSAYFFGASGIVICAKNSAPLSGVVSKASAGSLELMELRSCKNMMQFLTASAENGWRVLGGSVSPKAVTLNQIEPRAAPTILVLGNEGVGLRPLVERSCTQLVKIPGNLPLGDDEFAGDEDTEQNDVDHGHSSHEDSSPFLAVESLNVSVAAGVMLHHLIGSLNSSVIDEQLSGSAQ